MAKQTHSDEKLMTVYYQAVDFFEKNKKHVYTALAILVAVIAGIIILVNKNKANSENANVALSQIKKVYNNNEFQQAIDGDSLGNVKGLLYIVNEYGSTDAGNEAKIMLGNCYFSLRNFDTAEKYYKDFSGSNPILKAAAAAGLASVNEARQKFEEAASGFEKAASVDSKNPFIDQYLFYAAKNYARAGQDEKASKIFDRIKKDFPKSKYVMESERYKAGLSTEK